MNLTGLTLRSMSKDHNDPAVAFNFKNKSNIHSVVTGERAGTKVTF